MSELNWTNGQIATLACCLEVAAPKPGNVHRGADFEDVTLEDFLTSAVVLGHVIDQYEHAPVGETILAAVSATQTAIGTNTNLGIILLLVPLAKAANATGLKRSQQRITKVLADLNTTDTEQVYAAIRAAKPGGLGNVDNADVNQPPTDQPVELVSAMKLAADRDLIARQYTNGFKQVFDFGVSRLLDGRKMFSRLSDAIVYAHVATMSEFPDSLIARKCGLAVAEHSQFLAQKCIAQIATSKHQPLANDQENYWAAVSELDFWLRSDGHKRNPGTTADLIAASLFVSIQNKKIAPPYR